MSSTTATQLAAQILAAMDRPNIQAKAEAARDASKALGFESDWDAVPEKLRAFRQAIFASATVLPPGGSVETGVFRGGTSGPLILSNPPESFHIGIDPFGNAAQSYPELAEAYAQWKPVRSTLARLTKLAQECDVTYLHYAMGSTRFAECDLLEVGQQVRVVHLDGDHGEQAVVDELTYFRRKIQRPCLFVLDDHDSTYPGVENGMQRAGQGMAKVFHRLYDYPGFPTKLGFSAWVHCP